MQYKQKTLAKKLGCTVQTLEVYISRPDFAHIKKIQLNDRREKAFTNVWLSDIDKLQQLVNYGKKKTRWKK